MIGLGCEVSLPRTDSESHRSPAGEDRELDSEALAALRIWYADDYEILAACKAPSAEL